jgi:serine/threonine protein kinase
MNDQERPSETEGESTAALLAEIAERLRRGEMVRIEDYPLHAERLRSVLPTMKMMAELPKPRPPVELGNLGDFKLLREVSRGGMGIVYEAVQVSLGRRVALKVLASAATLDSRTLQRFHLEAQAAASLNHPHIVPVFATGPVDGVSYYAMRFIDGRDLSRVIRERRRNDLPETETDTGEPRMPLALSAQGASFFREAARLAKQAADALEHAHSSEVLHRDVKPSNLLIDGKGELWITDFGLARVRGGVDLTQTGDALGTPRYMSPEQAAGRRTPLDGRTDIYSLGVTLYELLTLQPAFPGDDRIEILRRISQDEPTPPRKLDSTIPVDLETIVLKAIAKAPADRYTTAGELADDLGRFLENRPIHARRPSVADRGGKWVRRHRTLVAGLAAAGGFVTVALAFAGWKYASLLRAHNLDLQAAVAKAEEQTREADRQRRLADRHAFASNFRLAAQAVQTGQLEAAQDLLNSIRPKAVEGEPIDFAWHYLRRIARREIVRLSPGSYGTQPLALTMDGRMLLS